MDDQQKIVHLGGTSGRPIEPLATRTPTVTLDIMPREPHLRDYLWVLRRHVWLIAAFTLAVVTIVSIETFRMQPLYQATARIEIDRENTNILPFSGTESYDIYEDLEEYIETQSRILTSQTLALLTINSLKLDEDPRFGGHPKDPSALEVAPASGAARLPSPLLGAFLGGLSVRRVPNSRLLDVTFSSSDPTLAAKIVNAHIGNFIEENFQSRYEATTQASTWLAGQLDELKARVETSEDARIEYERKNQIWTIDDKQDVTTQKLEDISKELTQAEADSISREAVYRLVQEGNLDTIPEIRGNSVIQDTLKQYNTLEAQYADALNLYGPNFPKVQRLQEQIDQLSQLVTNEKIDVSNQIEAAYRGAKQRELLLRQALDQQKGEASAMADKMVEYNILKRESDANKQLYDGLLGKLKEAGITAGLKSSNIRVVDPALTPTAPSQPNKTRNIELAILVGLVGGIGLAVLREYLDNTMKNPDDIETLGRLPSLAVVPTFLSANGHSRSPKLLTSKATNGNGTIGLVSHQQPQSQMAEAFRALRTSLLLSQADRPPQVILVTSPLPSDGKTTSAVNLAVTLAQLGDRTLLVDADIRKPGVWKALGLPDGKHVGLSSYLAGVSPLELIITPHPSINNLALVPTGPTPPNPADLLSSHRLREMVTQLRNQFKFIVIDSPPVLVATDPVILSVAVDGVLLVVRSGKTPKEAFVRARDLLASVKCHTLGVVLNGVDATGHDYHYSYRYYPYAYGAYGNEGGGTPEKQGNELNI